MTVETKSIVIGGICAGRHERGLLIEYAWTQKPLVLPFLFNPSAITRSRSVTVKTGGIPGARGGYGFLRPEEAPRASQGVTVNVESFSFKILLDATDRMNQRDPMATRQGVQPEIDVIRAMLEPKAVSSEGRRDLVIATDKQPTAHEQHEAASVLIFKWGRQVLPVFMTQAQIEAQAYLPSLFPYRAEVTLTLQVIETDNPFYANEQRRQQAAARNFSSLAGLPDDLLKF